MGTDLRYMTIPNQRILRPELGDIGIGIDINSAFFSLGRELCNVQQSDEPALQFIEHDIASHALAASWPRFDVVYCGSVFHLFSLDDTRKLAHNLADATVQGGLLYGRTVGVEGAAREQQREQQQGDLRYLHNAETLAQLLGDAGFSEVSVTRAQRGSVGGSASMTMLEFSAIRKTSRTSTRMSFPPLAFGTMAPQDPSKDIYQLVLRFVLAFYRREFTRFFFVFLTSQRS
jgi:hypothetical protein